LGGPSTTMPVHDQPRDQTQKDRTLDLPESRTSHHANGQASGPAWDWPAPAESTGAPAPRTAPRNTEPAPAMPADVAATFQTVQENLRALQHLNEQAAALHRQFLEGQEKTQQTFLRLLEHQQRLSMTWTDAITRHQPTPGLEWEPPRDQ